MPSLAVSDGSLSPKKKPKSSKRKVALLLAGEEETTIHKKKKEKKLERRDTTSEEAAAAAAAAKNGVRSDKKKNKMSSDDEDVVENGEEEEEEKAGDNPDAVSNFRISEALRGALRSKGIESLFPIQAMTFDIILDGSDLVGRARTGQGKTLAFVLPILESLANGRSKPARRTGCGRPPAVLVLLPTRELANQVFAEFEFYGGAVELLTCCLYGGSPYGAQELALKRGVDIVVGTPGRIKDHLERGTLDLKSLKFRVLDEADEMLKMGFVDDVELILKKVEDANKVQTLLLSATLPDWVKKLKASASVRHLVLPCSRSARAHLIPDIIRCYSRGGRTIIFTETKASASELTGLLPGSRALHGNIAQAQREVILAGFRSGRFLVLVATNVAARGLDINDVQLIIQCEPPRDVEAYIHRSGRTGRAGNSGVAILLFEPKNSNIIYTIERESGINFERISPPQPADIAQLAGSAAADAISDISDSVIPVFQSQAVQLLASSDLPAVGLLAKALAKAAGYTDIKERSLLSSMESYVAFLLQAGTTMYSTSFAFGFLRRFLSDDKISGVRGLALTADGKGAVFDVPIDNVDLFIEGFKNAKMVSIEVLKELPLLQDGDRSRGGHRGLGRFGGRRFL